MLDSIRSFFSTWSYQGALFFIFGVSFTITFVAEACIHGVVETVKEKRLAKEEARKTRKIRNQIKMEPDDEIVELILDFNNM